MRVTFAYFDLACADPSGDMDMALHGVVDLPLGLGCVRAFAEQDPEVAGRVHMANRVFPASVGDEEAVQTLLATSPDIVAFSCFLWNAQQVSRVCLKIKELAPGVRTVIGGPEVPRHAPDMRRFLSRHPEIDAAVAGEGEETFLELLKAWLQGCPPGPIPGLGWRANGGINIPPAAALPPDLARIPSPYLNGAIRISDVRGGFLPLETSRGCPLACAYCDYHQGRHDVRFFPLERLARELDWLAAHGYHGHLFLTDPLLNLRPERFLSVLRLLQDWKNPVFDLHPEMFDERSIRAMSAISAPKLYLGIQSTNPRAMRHVGRTFNLGRITDNLSKLLRHPNIQVNLELIVGLPGDDYESFKRTLDWALGFDPRPRVAIYDLFLLPNAPMHSLKDSLGIKTDTQGCVLSSATFSAEDRRKAFRLNGAYVHLASEPGGLAFLSRRARPTDALEQVAASLEAPPT